MHAAAAARVVESDWGWAFLQPALPVLHVENFVWAAEDASADALADAAERILGGADLPHRVVTAPFDGAVPGLRERGFVARPEWFMALDRPPDRVDAGAAVEVDLDVVLPGLDHWHATEIAWTRDDPAARAQAVEHHRTYGSAGADERLFAVLGDDGAAIAWCKLWTRDGVAQVEDVAVLPGHRGHGHGRAVVTAALQAAEATAPELTFIVADEDDWPRLLYGKLGFGRVGTFHVVTREQDLPPALRP